MKKLKWILLIITIIMMAFFLFATCRKTKAYTYDLEKPFFTQTYEFNELSESGFAMIINVDKAVSFNLLSIVGNNTYYYLIDCNYGLFRLSNFSQDLYTYNTASLETSYFYIQFCYDYVQNEAYIYFSPIDLVTGVSQGQAYVSSVILLNQSTYWPLTRTDFLQDYTSSQPETKVQLNYAYNPTGSLLPGLIQFYLFDIDQQFSEDIYEQTELLFDDVKRDISLSYTNYLLTQMYDTGYDDGEQDGYDIGYNAGYNAGYSAGETAGYQDGYDNGWRDGEHEGYDNGYDAGLLAGYNNGYADGLADNVAGQTEAYNAGYGQGRHDGYVEGYDRGYNLGYDDGLANGMSGATPVSQTIGVVSSIFAGIGTVLSVQLFPGFPLGILILVPLFFAVLGLILWIWRRN